MKIAAGCVRFFLTWFIVALFLLITSIASPLISDPFRRHRFYARIMSICSRIGIAMLGFRVRVNGLEGAFPGSSLVVSNHLSYTDIFLISSIYPSLFITSVEVRETFFLGAMSTLGGSIFVERRNRTSLMGDIEKVAETIRSGQRVVLFPEGTSSNGEEILPFKASLFAVAENSDVAVQPICISYKSINWRRIDPANRDRLYYYGDIEFFPHFLALPFMGSVDVEISFLEPIIPKCGGMETGMERKELARLCRERINAVYSAGIANE